MIKRIIDKIFLKKRVEDIFKTNKIKKVELGCGYCSDVC